MVASRKMGAMGIAASLCWALDSGEVSWAVRGNRMLLVAGLLAVALTLSDMGAVSRSLGSGNGKACVFSGR